MLRRVATVAHYALLGLWLLLLGATLVLWARSYWRGDVAVHYNQPQLFQVHSVDGLLRIAWGDLVSRNYPPPPGWHGTFFGDSASFDADLATGTRLGFQLEHFQRRTPDLQADATSFTFPYWLLAFICLAWPVTSFIIARRRRKGRGFEVAAAGTSNIEHPTSNIEVP